MKIEFRKFVLFVMIGVLSLSLLISGCSSNDEENNNNNNGDDTPVIDETPGEGVTVKPARATWDTGWFQTEIFILALEELGYDVDRPLSLDNAPFYQSLSQGDVDFWANGWFPIHNTYLEGKEDKIELIGYEVQAGALQGYLIDKATSEAYGITNLEDFKDPEIAALFDTDGNGLANMVACPPGWGCELVIDHHIEAYGLQDSIETPTAQYAVSMVDAIARYNQGEPILFYTWTPNWTVDKLKIGEDVVWLEVPFPSLPESQKQYEDKTTISNLEGKAGDSEPYDLGYPANDIRCVANSEFLAANPAAAYIFEHVEIPVADIFAQNALMFDGEDRPEDIIQHAEDWIAENQNTFDAWIQGAIDAANE